MLLIFCTLYVVATYKHIVDVEHSRSAHVESTVPQGSSTVLTDVLVPY